MSIRETETVDLPRKASATAELERPALTLVYGRGGLQPLESRALPYEGLQIGRGLPVFGGQPLNDRSISRRHASIELQRGAWIVRDLGSRNGVLLNGALINEQAPLSPGDVLRIGETLLVFGRGRLSLKDDPRFVGRTRGVQQLRDNLSAVAPHGHTVLLHGETGTGKEVAARLLHELSGRRGQLVALNCAALPEGTIESQLFGHKKGSFTGADREQGGLFLAADGGTLFLDELGELPLGLQSKLLRTLETGRIRPVGSDRELAVDVRVVSATNRDLPQMVRDGTFRSDLFARVAQWIVELPPLRERREDILLLTRHLLKRLGARDRLLDIELAQALLIQPWALNVRGLNNALVAATVLCPEGPLQLVPALEATLKTYLELEQAPAAPAAPAAAAPAPDTSARSTGRPDRATLEAALRQNSGQVAATARALGTSRMQIYRWMRSYGLEAEDFREP
jgi:transcriptional regulator with GAF, ATPase, and Fis domain